MSSNLIAGSSGLELFVGAAREAAPGPESEFSDYLSGNSATTLRTREDEQREIRSQ